MYIPESEYVDISVANLPLRVLPAGGILYLHGLRNQCMYGYKQVDMPGYRPTWEGFGLINIGVCQVYF